MDLRQFVHRIVTGHRVRLPRDMTDALQRAAEQAFVAAHPGREANGSVLWVVEGDDVIVCVYQRAIRPSNAPTFVRVHPTTGGASLIPRGDYARYFHRLFPLK
jgi:hypothetical protein